MEQPTAENQDDYKIAKLWTVLYYLQRRKYQMETKEIEMHFISSLTKQVANCSNSITLVLSQCSLSNLLVQLHMVEKQYTASADQ